MSDLGALLRKAREQRGLSLDDIQELTKIRKRYLEAIEEGDYAILPGSFYVRAFVKNYAETVGLDADEVLRLYRQEIPSPAPEPAAEPVQRPRRSQSRSASDRWSRWGFRTLMWSFLLLIVVIVYIFAVNRTGGDNVDSADQSKMTDQTTPPVTQKETGGGNTTVTEDNGGSQDKETESVTPTPTGNPVTPAVQTTLTLKRTSGRTDYYEVAPTGTHKIELKAVGGASWVGVRENNSKGKYLMRQTLKDGDSQTIEVAGPVYVNVGFAKVVEVTVDGVLIDDGNGSGPRRMQLDPAAEAGTETGTQPSA
jgi:cytoskeletal protein RodZ